MIHSGLVHTFQLVRYVLACWNHSFHLTHVEDIIVSVLLLDHPYGTASDPVEVFHVCLVVLPVGPGQKLRGARR